MLFAILTAQTLSRPQIRQSLVLPPPLRHKVDWSSSWTPDGADIDLGASSHPSIRLAYLGCVGLEAELVSEASRGTLVI